jgi:DNA-binding winged helix-turn-helix (wHTH) protein/tetratricopeptide (TPR) repeat protein
MNTLLHREPIVLAREGAMRIGLLRVEPALCLLRDGTGREQAIEPRVMQVLVALHRAGGSPITRDDLLASCWSGRVVSMDAVSRIMSILRAISLDIGAGTFRVETLNKVGYRLVQESVSDAAVDVAVPAAQPRVAPEASAPLSHAPGINRRETLIGCGVAGMVLLGAGWSVRNQRPRAAPPGGNQTIAVMPFHTNTADHQLDAVATSAAMAMRKDLDRIPSLRVISGIDSEAMADGTVSVPQSLSRIGVTLALTGSLERLTAGFNLILTLSDTAGGHQLWSSAVSAPLDQPHDLYRDAAGLIIEQLVLRLPVAPVEPIDTASRQDPEAHRLAQMARGICDDVRELLLSGQTQAAQTQADQAITLLDQALRIEPENASALVVMADLARNGWGHARAARRLTTQQRVEEATSLLRRALRVDPTSAGAMARLADIYRRFSWRWDDAETLFRHALANDPANVDAHWAYSHELATMGRALEGLDHALALWDLDHQHLWRRIDLPRMLLFSGLHKEAMRAYDREIQRAPGNTYLLYELYYLNVAKRNADGLARLETTLTQLWQGRAQPEAVQGILRRCDAARRALGGDPAPLQALLDAERAAFEAGGLSQATLGGRARDDIGFILAIEYALAGDRDRSIAMLDQALQAMSVYWLPSLPYGDAPFPQAIRQDLRFQALWQRDPRLADLVERRRQAAAQGQMASLAPDGTDRRPAIDAALGQRIRAALDPS